MRARWSVLALVVAAGISVPSLAQPEPPREGRPPSGVNPGGTKVDLRPRLHKGQEIHLVLTSDDTLSPQPGAAKPSAKSPAKRTHPSKPAPRQDDPELNAGETADESSSSHQEIGILLRCTTADPEKGFDCEMVFEAVKFSSSSTGIAFDSTTPAAPDDPMDSIIRSMVGQKFPVHVTRDGEVTMGGKGDSLPSLLNGLGGGRFSAADLFSNMLGPATTTAATNPSPRVGESWTTRSSLEGGMASTRVEMTHTLVSAKGGEAVIRMVGKVLVEPSSGGGDQMPQVRIPESEISGKATWNLEDGMVNESNTHARLLIQTVFQGQTKSAVHEMNTRIVRAR